MAKTKAAKPKRSVSPSNNRPYQFVRSEVSNLMPQYMMIRDAIEGESAIKGMICDGVVFPTAAQTTFGWHYNVAKAKRYLPQPNPEDLSDFNLKRYENYLTRAVYYNVSARTLNGMSGQVFLRDPDKFLPPQLEILNKDADGTGKTLDQVADHIVRNQLAYSRAGLLVDYPVKDDPTTQAQIESGEVRPIITAFDPWQIVSWQVQQRNGLWKLVQIVLCEYIDGVEDDGFTSSTERQWRVLSLDDDNQHQVKIYADGDDLNRPSGGNYAPRNGKGQPFNYIPFFFVGAENNAPAPNKPLFADLVVLNIGHYRNSADYEESCFVCGQPTPVISGLDQQWVETVLKGTVTLGSPAAVTLPAGAKMELVQATENSMPIEAMRLKESQMVAIGAKLVQVQKVQKTATQQINEETTESSPLQKIALNASMAMEAALRTACEFIGINSSKIKYQLNRDYDLTSMSSDDQQALILEWQTGCITYPEMRKAFRRAGIAYMDDDSARATTLKEIKDGLIPDPSMQNALQKGAIPKPPSGAGGPQPGAPRNDNPGTIT